MSGMSPQEFARQIGAGLLSFPVTHFSADGSAFEEGAYRTHIEWLLGHGPAGIVCGGRDG